MKSSQHAKATPTRTGPSPTRKLPNHSIKYLLSHFLLFRHLYTVINQEISKADVASKHQSLREDDLVAEMLPHLVTEEVRLLERDLKKSILNFLFLFFCFFARYLF